MAKRQGILAVDQGTTSSRAIVFALDGSEVSRAREPFFQHYPQSGWVEHDARALLPTTVDVCNSALADAEAVGTEVIALGLTNQRETTVVWDRATGEPIHHAIVWQDRRTAETCAGLRAAGHGAAVTARTGLLLDPYFSATKIAWLLDHVPGARERAEAGALAFGTVDSWLIWCLTDGAVHATDATNAARTLLFDIHAQDWSDELLALFGVPRAMLPEVCDSADDFGSVAPGRLERSLPIRGVAGDQHAAMVGQGCFEAGTIKSTYGTGCFALLHTGEEPTASDHGLLTTMAYRLEGRPAYALEGAIFSAGSTVQWLRDGLGIIEEAAETEELAGSIESTGGVHLVPAFTGMGAPWWDPHARGALLGLTRATGPAELARAALESVCFQTHDLARAMAGDAGREPCELRVDGGMVVNDWFLQRLADLVGIEVLRPAVVETTALGAAYLAGLGHGIWRSPAEVVAYWQLDTRFSPGLGADERAPLIAGWHDAVGRIVTQ